MKKLKLHKMWAMVLLASAASACAQSGLAQSSPAQTSPVRSSPVQSSPVQSGVAPSSHEQQQAPKGGNGFALKGQFVKTGLFLFSSEGSNSLLRLSANGLIVVDGQPAAGYDALRSRARRISEQPIRALILTDHDAAHTASDAKFLADGTRIIAQENVARNLAANNSSGEPIAPPSVTYDEQYLLQLGGVEAQLLHFGNAHSSGDTVVYFPNLKAVAVGDLFAATPNPDYRAGGSMLGWGAVLDKILKLDFDVAVPGAGAPIRRSDLEAFKTKIDTLVSRASALVKNGATKDQLMSRLKTDDLGWQLNFSSEQVDGFYAELSQAR